MKITGSLPGKVYDQSELQKVIFKLFTKFKENISVFRKILKYFYLLFRVRRRGVGTKYMGSTSLSSPISILASPSSLVPGPLSAPATFSWGKQSPIPHRVTTPSPFLLSPGQEHYPSALASSPLIHTPDPLPRQFLQGEGKGPALSLGSEVPKPCIPVGIAVARQRTSETIHPTPPSSKQPGVQVEPWNIPNIPSLPVLPSHQLIHPLPLPDFFTNQPMQGKNYILAELATLVLWRSRSMLDLDLFIFI